jgi:excinuclease ABC subunit C
MQLYQDKIPAENILLSHSINNSKLFTKALKELHGVNVKIEVLKKSGSTANLMQIALENARIALEQHLKNSAKNRYALEEVQKLFNLPSLPNRIEVYDNSHIQGAFAIGAMVVAGREGFDKKEYRLFTIKGQPQNIGGGDDYAMLREVLTRRLSRLKNEPYRSPDLMIIDGGIGHMNIVKQILEKFSLNIPFVCMSKGVDRNSGREQFHRPNQEIFTLDKTLPVMKYLQILRDEAHNFAIKNHRKKRSKAIKISSLDNIPGIGEMRKKILLSYFGSFAAVSDATVDELTKVEGINKELAQIVYEALHK